MTSRRLGAVAGLVVLFVALAAATPSRLALYNLTTLARLTLTQGPLLLPDGTAALPSLAGSTYPTTGLFWSSGPTLNWSVSGAAELQLTAAALAPAVTGGLTLGTGSLEFTTVFANNYTTTGVVSNAGLTLGANEWVGINAGAAIVFGIPNVSGLAMSTGGADYTHTSGDRYFARMQTGFSPASGSGQWAMLQVNPTFNGTSSAVSYALVVASKTNDLRGGRIELLSAGTTTDDAFTGYSRFFALTNHGALLLGTSPSDSYVRAHFAAALHAETSFAVGAHVVTVANNTVGASANTEILSGYRSLYLVDCNDPDGCTMQLGTAGIEAGAITRIISITTSANTLTAASVASVQHVASSFTMGTNDVISLQFVRNRSGAGIWLETGRSNN